jgi:hypothetical protein
MHIIQATFGDGQNSKTFPPPQRGCDCQSIR